LAEANHQIAGEYAGAAFVPAEFTGGAVVGFNSARVEAFTAAG